MSTDSVKGSSIVLTDTDEPAEIIGRVLRASAILNTYIASLTEDDADGRYVLWTVRDILDQVSDDIERIPVQEMRP
jgi:hypothetical protein